MVFLPPSWVPAMPKDVPDSIPVHEFMSNEKYGRRAFAKSRPPFICGVTGRSYSCEEFFSRTESLARALSKHLGWKPNEGTEWEKVLGIFSLNSIDFITAAYGAHRLSGVATPASAAYTATELEHQLRNSGAQALFTCTSLLETGLKACKAAGIPNTKIFLLPMPTESFTAQKEFLTVEDLVREGQALPKLDSLSWYPGQGARQTAFLCYSSGTSGLPKAVMISHFNMIANAVQHATYEAFGRAKKSVQTQTLHAPLPMSHIFALMVASHSATYRGDSFVILPKYELNAFLGVIERFKVNQVLVVPPILIQMLGAKDVCRKYDLSSLRYAFSGAAPLGDETIKDVKEMYPNLTIGQAYGMTESSVVITCPSEHDVYQRASGSLLPGYRVKLVNPDGLEITQHDHPGEVFAQGPSITLGYLNNERATTETFVHDADGRWLRTGDEGLFTLAPSGNEQLVIIDRIKELIKVKFQPWTFDNASVFLLIVYKGHQVAPAELEAHILAHPAVDDCAVIQVPDQQAGEVPKALVVRNSQHKHKPEVEAAEEIVMWVRDHKASYKWIKGGIEFVDVIPKSPSGKILRRILRDREKALRQRQAARL